MIGIDSNVVVYSGIVPPKGKGKLPKSTLELIRRSKILMASLHDEGEVIVLPSICVAEVLIPIAKAKKSQLLAALSAKFICHPFDAKAAVIAADLWNRFKKSNAKTPAYKREVLKSDAMIIATAKAAGCSKFYTADKQCRKLANLIMTGCDLPTHSEDLFFDQ